MEQHPIPQQISSYQFRLVGDMTLKQFFQLAGGFLVGLLFYASPLIGIIKWPFAIVSVILGALLAFVPLEERPLEQWILAFFKAIYTPTLFYWKKTVAPQKFFQDETVGPAPVVGSPEQEIALKSYMATNKQGSSLLSKFDSSEQGFLAMLGGLFAGTKNVAITSTVAQPATEKRPMEIPVSVPVKITAPSTPHFVVEEKARVASVPEATSHAVSPIVAGNEIISTNQAIFSIDAAPPNPPTYPNVVVGQVVDENRKIIEGAIMEIKDELGRPIRALRSNKLGHFITVTPLDNGRYGIATEKDDYQFNPVSFDATGSLIPPILVQGKKIVSTTVVPAVIPNLQ